jgi:hypothetical protein
MPLHRLRRVSVLLARLIVLLGVVEVGAALTTRGLVGRGWIAEIPVFTPQQREDYFARRDTMVGWRASFETPVAPCVSVYGDGVTAGTAQSSYPAELERLLQCEVTNYGVGGYGSDQAMLLSQSMRTIDRAPVSVIGHVSDNILRNLNQYRHLLDPGQELSFKPRLFFDGGELRTLEIPIRRREDFERLRTAPHDVLLYDEFFAGAKQRFPYTVSLSQWLLNDYRVRAKVTGTPAHEPFYHPEHPLAGLQLTTAILSKFVLEKANDGRKSAIVLIPAAEDFAYMARGHAWPDQPLVAAFNPKWRVLHVGPKMLERLKGEDPCSLFDECRAPFNARGYRMLADIVAEGVNDLVPPRPPARGSR